MKNTVILLAILLMSFGCKVKEDKTITKKDQPITEEVKEIKTIFEVAPTNPFAGGGVYPMPHGDPAQQDATNLSGPLDTSRKLNPDEIQYVFTGPASIGAYTTKYKNGKSVLWLSVINGIMKVDDDTYEILAQIPFKDAEKYTEELAQNYTDAFDQDNSLKSLKLAGEAAGVFQDVSGVYAVVDKDNRFYVADKGGNVTAYGDIDEGNPNSEIEIKGKFSMPDEVAGSSLGMNITYDGWIVLPTENGFLVAVSRDFKEYRYIQLKHVNEGNTESQGVGYGWVRNSIAIDKDGGIYVASRDHMHKVIWNGEKFSTNEADGAWTAKYSNSGGGGTGATPSLMGFGDEDQFVVITDGDELMNMTLFWRNGIPEDWKQLGNAPSRRIAGMVPITMGELNLKEIQTEQSSIVAGYGVFVVNNAPRNVPEGMPRKVSGVMIGHLGANPDFQPFGVQKLEWNPETRTLGSAWVNTTVSSPNGVPWVSLGSDRVYFIGARDNQWTLEAVDWTTGVSDFYYTIGGSQFNSLYSGPVINEDGSVMYGSSWGRVKLKPNNNKR